MCIERTSVVVRIVSSACAKMKFLTNFEFWYQMKAMTIRNMLIKRREIKKTFSVSTHETDRRYVDHYYIL